MKETTLFSASGPTAPTHAQISQRAEELWRSLGCPGDRDDAIWLEAERDLHHGLAASPSAQPASATQRTGNRTPGRSSPQ